MRLQLFDIAARALSPDGFGLVPKQLPASIGDDELPTAITLQLTTLCLIPYTSEYTTFTMADSNSNAPITAASVRPNRPLSEALLNEKVGIAREDLQEEEYRRCKYTWTRLENIG